jgi:hypothetical protein
MAIGGKDYRVADSEGMSRFTLFEIIKSSMFASDYVDHMKILLSRKTSITTERGELLSPPIIGNVKAETQIRNAMAEIALSKIVDSPASVVVEMSQNIGRVFGSSQESRLGKLPNPNERSKELMTLLETNPNDVKAVRLAFFNLMESQERSRTKSDLSPVLDSLCKQYSTQSDFQGMVTVLIASKAVSHSSVFTRVSSTLPSIASIPVDSQSKVIAHALKNSQDLAQPDQGIFLAALKVRLASVDESVLNAVLDSSVFNELTRTKPEYATQVKDVLSTVQRRIRNDVQDNQFQCSISLELLEPGKPCFVVRTELDGVYFADYFIKKEGQTVGSFLGDLQGKHPLTRQNLTMQHITESIAPAPHD